MCHSRCSHENYHGECTAREINGLLPCDDGYGDAADYDEYLREEAEEQRAESRREMRDQEERHGIS